jgi:hypothetical protein
MLYKRLFDTHAKGQFDWARFFKHMRLEAEEPFSEAFLTQCTAICASLGIPIEIVPVNLDLLAQSLSSLHRDVGILDDQLELVYRWRGSANASPVKKPHAKKARQSSSSEAEDEELQRAIAASLVGQKGQPIAIEIGAGEAASSAPLTPQANTGKRRRKDSQMPASPSKTPQTAELARKAAEIRESEEGDIIGTTKFTYQGDKLSAYLDQALTFWNGRVSELLRTTLFILMSCIRSRSA